MLESSESEEETGIFLSESYPKDLKKFFLLLTINFKQFYKIFSSIQKNKNC